MRETDNFNLTIPEGSDNVNILTQITPNFETIDEVMKNNENAGVQVATVLYSNNIHAITRTKDDASVMRFTATSRFTLGDTFTVDGVQVTALAPTGEQLPDGAFIVGSEVIAILKGTLLTVFAGSKATDSAKLNGQSADFYATKAEVDNAQTLAEGSATIAQSALAKTEVISLPIGLNNNVEQGSAIIKRVGNIVNLHLTGIKTLADVPAHSGVEIATITDPRFLPTVSSVYGSARNIVGGARYEGSVEVSPSGVITLGNLSNTTSKLYSIADLTYFVD